MIIIIFAEVLSNGFVNCGIVDICGNANEAKYRMLSTRIDLERENYHLEQKTDDGFLMVSPRGSLHMVKCVTVSENDRKYLSYYPL